MTNTTNLELATRVIDHNEFARLLQQAVDERGEDFVYPKEFGICMYSYPPRVEQYMGDFADHQFPAHDREFGRNEDAPVPACIVGYVASIIGGEVWETTINMRDNFAAPAFIRTWLDGRTDRDGNTVKFTEKAINIAAAAQHGQDAGDTWGHAVADALHDYAHYFEEEQ